MDDVDIATVAIEKSLASALAAQKAKALKEKTKFTGHCIWCDDPVENKKIFCSTECRDYHTIQSKR